MATFTESLASRQAAANAYAAARTYAALFTADPGNAAGANTNELTGGPGPYARPTITWASADTNARVTGQAIFPSLPGSVTVTYVGLCTAISGATVSCSFQVSAQIIGSPGSPGTANFVLQF